MDDVNLTDILSRYHVPRHRLTVADYRRLGEARILGKDDRVELLEGQLVDMSPIGPRHALTIDLLNRLLPATLGEQAWLRVQNPIVLDDASEPQPTSLSYNIPGAAILTCIHGHPTFSC